MPDILQGNATETRLLTDEHFLRKVAYLYYEDGHSQESIAGMEDCSRQTVSKALQKARERGIVRISIVPDLRTGYLRNLTREVRTALGLEDLVLVAGQSTEVLNEQGLQESVVSDIASAAADYLDQLLGDGDILAVSGGQTFMRNLVRYARPSKVLPHMRVVATIGFASANTNYGDANLIAYDLAQAYGAIHQWFPCPAFLKTREEVSQAHALPLINEAYEMMEQANVTVTGLWTWTAGQDDMLTPEQLEEISAYHPVADINHWIFDGDGRCINDLLETPPYFLSGLKIPSLKDKLKQNNSKVILVAGGGPSYVPAIRAVLRAELANILVTDHLTAERLLTDE